MGKQMKKIEKLLPAIITGSEVAEHLAVVEFKLNDVIEVVDEMLSLLMETTHLLKDSVIQGKKLKDRVDEISSKER